MELVDKKIYERAKKAIKISSLNANFYKVVEEMGITSNFVFQNKKTYIKKNLIAIRNSDSIESEFLWLIKIGVLRREVDGQGLTSKVRITPLGKKVIKENLNSIENKINPLRKAIICFQYLLERK